MLLVGSLLGAACRPSPARVPDAGCLPGSIVSTGSDSPSWFAIDSSHAYWSAPNTIANTATVAAASPARREADRRVSPDRGWSARSDLDLHRLGPTKERARLVHHAFLGRLLRRDAQAQIADANECGLPCRRRRCRDRRPVALVVHFLVHDFRSDRNEQRIRGARYRIRT